MTDKQVDWNLLTLVGADRAGIVARVTRVLYGLGCHLGEASMIRLGGNFTIMLMVSAARPNADILAALAPVAAELELRVHLDAMSGGLHQHLLPNLQVRVTGADRAGIVADVTEILAAQGFNILELESDVAGDRDRPVYIMNIQGYSDHTIESLADALAPLSERGVAVDVAPVDVLIG
ncbi:glycine cleavage system transcriptional repressor [Allochromatium warmingii]|uniref:Glycine cleavage system transcriptional repressor n=1 Tax=Allochromatium warmingii TaxID=61595 RepID=A0A1H3EDN2_ALLWA|nr:ACT domain-containing protein [Allochromatium warmingii]SDX76833.1 glycine cleavage system transcriptional repressor [Allochromatium warmingii]